MATHSSGLMVFTDLDGSLLDHFSYCYDAARPALARLRKHRIPCILTTSKTAAELLPLLRELDNTWPAIVENGAAVLFPEGTQRPAGATSIDGQYFQVFAPKREQILQVLAEWRSARQGSSLLGEDGGEFVGFSDMDIEQLVAMTGLPASDAELALQRQFSEPIIWRGDDGTLRDFIAALASRDLRVLRGGRFLHIMGQADKGAAMRWLTQRLCKQMKPLTVALGDSENDIAMLEVADIAVIIRSPVHPPPVLEKVSRRIVTTKYGPEAWADAVMAILDEQGLD